MAEAVVDQAPVQSEPKKSKLWLFIVLGVLVLGGGGAGAYFAFGAKHEAPAKADSKGAKEAAPKGPALYISLDPPFVVNFDAQQAVRFLQITVQVMTRDVATQTLLKENDPVIRNNLLLLFGGQKYEVVSTREGKEQLRTEALEAVRKTLKAEGGNPELVEAVYFTSLVMQ